MLYLSVDGTPYGGDRQTRADGTLDPILPDRPSPAYQWNGSAWVLPLATDWSTFRTQIINDAAYQKMVIGVMITWQGNWLVMTVQDTLSLPATSIAMVQPLWNQIIQLTPLLSKPTTADIARWQGYANSTAVGITFLTSGAIQ